MTSKRQLLRLSVAFILVGLMLLAVAVDVRVGRAVWSWLLCWVGIGWCG